MFVFECVLAYCLVCWRVVELRCCLCCVGFVCFIVVVVDNVLFSVRCLFYCVFVFLFGFDLEVGF